jgi:hypothetical protein
MFRRLGMIAQAPVQGFSHQSCTPTGMLQCRLQPYAHKHRSIGIGLGILHRAMDVGSVLWLGMAHAVGRGSDASTTRHGRAGFGAGFNHMRLQVRPPVCY